ncbi:MAG: threonine--tRNA ligase [Buchnera aphidicola (Eriosoma harunire)]
MSVVSFYDGEQYICNHPVSLIELLKYKCPKMYSKCVGGYINDELVNLNTIVKNDCRVNFIYSTEHIAIDFIRNSCVHLLGYAIKLIWPQAQLANFGGVKNSFFYDFEVDKNVIERDLNILEIKMFDIVKLSFDIVIQRLTLQESIKLFTLKQEPYKVELLKEKISVNDYISLYYHQSHVDFDIGVQVPNISFCNNFKLHSISGAYWKNSCLNKMLYRVNGLVFLKNKDLSVYLNNLKLIKNRDHRSINKKLNLYHMQEDAPGMVFWHSNGLILFRILEEFIRSKYFEYNYQECKTPLMMDYNIWKSSGHWDNYKESMFVTNSENRQYCIKPMNCPGHVQIFNQGLKSYRDLPIRMAEFGSCHRQESSGSLHGLMRVRSFTQDDAHIFCTEEQIGQEIDSCIQMLFDVYQTFGFKKILIKLSTRPDHSIGNQVIWDKSEQELINVLKKRNLHFDYQPGEGAFYGPKIEFILQDSLNRTWQCGTIQLDFYLSTRLNSYYINQYNVRQSPIIIHRAILGSLERFIGILIEEYSGNFPFWLSPIQVLVMNIHTKQINYVKNITNILLTSNIRVKMDLRNEKMNFKVRDAIISKIPYIFICGPKEEEQSTVTVRSRSGKNFLMSDINIMIKKLQLENQNRVLSQMED